MWRSLAVIAIIICGIISTDADCTLDNIHFYREGAYWNPVQDTHQIGAGCVNCTCSNNTVKCSKVECPILNCEVPRYPVGACCPVCEVAPDDNGKAGDRDRNCEFEGRTYQHNQFFSNNHTNITPTKSNQCVNCICQSGQIYCFLKSCDVRKHCSKFYQSPDTCCPICVDNKTNDKIERRRPEDCTDGTEKERKNGTVWSPDVAGDVNPCITCTCLNGGITCERELCPKLQCPSGKSYPVEGKCCKTCDKPRKKAKKGGVCKKDRKRRRHSRKNKRKHRRRNRKGRSKRKDGRRNKKKNRRRERNKAKKAKNCVKVQHNVTVADKQCPSIQPAGGALPCHYNDMCLPARTEFIIYRFIIRGDKKTDDTLIIAFDNVKTHLVEIWKYIISKDKIKRRQELNKCASSSFRRQVKSPKAILGAASAQSVKDFQRKLRRGLKGCEKKKKGCRLRTVRRQMVCFDLEDIKINTCKN